MIERKSGSPGETREIGRELAAKLQAGDVITLSGDLGAGKTVFTKGLAEGLGVQELVTSPTFTILQEYYDGRLPLYHFDAYRIEDPEEMTEIGFQDFLESGGVCVIEWAERIEELLPARRIDITIERIRGDASGEARRIVMNIEAGGSAEKAR